MIQYQRRQEILKLLGEEHSLKIKDIAKKIFASESSVRRDLEELEKEGKAIILRPDKPVGFKRIETDVSKLTTLYYKGEYDGFSYENKIKEFIKEM